MPPEIVTPKRLKELAAEADLREAKKAEEGARKRDAEARELQDTFMQREIHPSAHERVSAAITRAAERGASEILIIQFPSKWLADRGRAINNNDPDWPSSLEGFAKRAYDYYEKNLKSLDYKIRARILDFPGGMPGDIGLFVAW
jgi:hypothetical protein